MHYRIVSFVVVGPNVTVLRSAQVNEYSDDYVIVETLVTGDKKWHLYALAYGIKVGIVPNTHTGGFRPHRQT